MEWMFRHYRALIYGSRPKFCGHRAQGLRPLRMAVLWNPGAGSEDRLDRHRVWIPDLGETHQAKLGEAGTGFRSPQDPKSGIRDPGR